MKKRILSVLTFSAIFCASPLALATTYADPSFAGMNQIQSQALALTQDGSVNYGTNPNPCNNIVNQANQNLKNMSTIGNDINSQISPPSSSNCLASAFSSFQSISSMLNGLSSGSILGALEGQLTSLGQNLVSNLENQACNEVQGQVNNVTGSFTGQLSNIINAPNSYANQISSNISNAVGGAINQIPTPSVPTTNLPSAPSIPSGNQLLGVQPQSSPSPAPSNTPSTSQPSGGGSSNSKGNLLQRLF